MADHEVGTFLFVVTGKADADHLGPVIWSLTADRSSVQVFTTTPAAQHAIETAWWLAERPNVLVKRVRTGRSRLGRGIRNVRWNRWTLTRWFRSNDVRIVVREWGEGIAGPQPSLKRRVLRYWATDFSTQVLFAARKLSIPTVALPHGHSTKTTVIKNQHVQAVMAANNGKLAFADRDSYDAYVFCSQYHRDAVVAMSTMNGGNTRIWGSARFNDDWVPRLYQHTKEAPLPAMTDSAVRRVLFFLPKWQNLVSRTDTLELLTAISKDEKTQVVVRGHLRAEAATISDAERAALESPHLVFVSDDVSSASLIKACDVIVDVDSSIAFDAVILGKPYVRPRYLQDASVSTIWDDLGGAHQTNSQQETLALLAQDQLLPAPRSEAFANVVFGGPGMDVLARYRDELASIAYGTTNPR